MSSVGYPSGSKRPGTAYAAAAAAKARRQMIFVGLLCLGLAALIFFEAPSFIRLFRGSKVPVNAPPVVTPPAPTPNAEKVLAKIRHRPASDPFSASVTPGGDSVVGDVAGPPGTHDPFAPAPSSGSSGSGSAAAATPLPSEIIIGAPGSGRSASHGWIVILASIPTSDGQVAAAKFAAVARENGIQQVGVLNSSNRRPLRGGYWVVYTGPFKSLTDVSSVANTVRSHGYATAYIRELVVFS